MKEYIIKNNYPKTDAGNRKYTEVRREAFKFFKRKTDIDLFLTLTEYGNGWQYRTDRIRKDTCMTSSQISTSWHSLIELGAISINQADYTLTINYHIVMHEKEKIPKKKSRAKQFIARHYESNVPNISEHYKKHPVDYPSDIIKKIEASYPHRILLCAIKDDDRVKGYQAYRDSGEYIEDVIIREEWKS